MTPQLRTDADRDPSTDGSADGLRVIELPAGDGTVTATLPDDASAGETAAIAAAVVAHLDAEEAESPGAEATETVCPWAVAGRIEPVTGRRHRGRAALPGDCPRGSEWRYAARCR